MKFISKNLKNFGLILALVISASACGKTGAVNQEQETGTVFGEENGQEAEPGIVAPPAPVADNCIPTTCDTQGKNCGEISDGCGGTLRCGECSGDLTCGGSGTDNVCGQIVTCYRYAFVSERNGDVQNVFQADTCNQQAPRRLTQNSNPRTRFDHLAFKPDGSRLGVDQSTSGDNQPFPLALLLDIPADPAGSVAIDEVLSDELGSFFGDDFFPENLGFEPNGERVAFAANFQRLNGLGPNAELVNLQNLVLSDPANSSSALRILVSGDGERIRFRSVTWHPLGGKVLFEQRESSIAAGDIKVHLIDSNRTVFLGREIPGNLPLIEPIKGSQLAVTAAGNRLAFIKLVDGNSQIFTCNLASNPGALARETCGGIRQITSEGNNFLPSWTPDGEFLLFSSDRDGDREIYQMKPDGSEVRALTENSGILDQAPAVHPQSFTVTRN